MKRSISFVALVLACGLGGQVFAGPCDDTNFNTVIFRDDFTGPDCSLPDDDWIVNHPDEWWWVLGRTFMPSQIYHPVGPFPHIQDNTCVITHYDYNPYDINPDNPDDPDHVKTTFLGGEIHTVMEFEPTRCYRFEARVRWPRPMQDYDDDGIPDLVGGLVTSFFTYGYYDDTRKVSDEIDFEYLSNEVFDPPHDVLTNTWDDSQQNHVQVPIPTLDITDWNVFRLYWCPATCVKWTWIDPVTGDEIVLRTEETSCIPDEAMSLYFNFWAPTADWPKAYDADFQPDQEDNGIYYEYYIDYAEVRVPEPASCMILAVGAAWLLGRRRQPLPAPH